MASFMADAVAPAAAGNVGSAGADEAGAPPPEPAWARQMRRKQQLSHVASTTAHVLRSGDHGGSGTSPSLRDDSNA
jgi:type IV secretion system protein TrbL